MDGVEIDHHAAAPFDPGQVLGGQHKTFVVISRGYFG